MRLRNDMSWIDKESKRIKKDFIRSNKDGGTFHTVKGVANTIVKIDNENIYIQCKSKDSTYNISRITLARAINKLFFKKYLRRKELEHICNYNTALFGILIEIFKDKITVMKDESDKRGWKILLKGVRYVPSGMCKASNKDWLSMKKAGIKFVMVSFYYATRSWYLWCIALDMYAIVDSGAFSVAKKRKGEICIYSYADFINKYRTRIHSFMNLDVIGDAEASTDNFNLLTELTGMKPIPVWHPVQDWENSDWDLLKEMVESNEIVAIGGTNKAFFKDDDDSRKKALFKQINKLHPNGQFHYLGGSSKLILEDTWIHGQADSSGWTRARGNKNPQIYSFQGTYATERRPDYLTSEEAILYSLIVLSNFEKSYGKYKQPVSVDKWSRLSKLTIEDLMDNIPYFKIKRDTLADLFKTGSLFDTIGERKLNEVYGF